MSNISNSVLGDNCFVSVCVRHDLKIQDALPHTLWPYDFHLLQRKNGRLIHAPLLYTYIEEVSNSLSYMEPGNDY